MPCSINRVFQLLLKDAFTSKFGYNEPRHTLLFRDLAFLPDVLQTDLPWRRIRLEHVRSFLDIDSRRWGHCLSALHSLDRSSARLVDIGNTLLNYRISIQQTVPTSMKVMYSWNLDNWHAPKQPKRDVRMRKCKRLLAKGPICLQETKWSASEKEVLMQHIPGLQIAESLATPTPGGHWSGGVAVLVPPGYVLKDSHNLVQGRAVAALIADGFMKTSFDGHQPLQLVQNFVFSCLSRALLAPVQVLPSGFTQALFLGCSGIGAFLWIFIVPLLVAWILAQPGHPWATLNDIAVNSRRTATICTLVLAAFRRLLRQEGAFVHQVRGEPKSVAWWCDTLIESTCQDATKELCVPLMHPRTTRMHCLLHAQLIDTVRVLPTDITTMHLPPVVNISLQNGQVGDRLGVIAVDGIHSAVFREMCYAPSERRKNVSLEYMHCQCGEYHIHVTLTEHVMSGDILTPCSFGPPKMFCQFDGSAHRAKSIGGAGAAMYVLSEQGLQLLGWSSVSIPRCPDNIVAEVVGADLSLRLYERYVHWCLSHNIVPLPLDRIQGDIQPLLSHLRFQTRFRRPDLIAVINRFHAKRSRLAPSSATEYRPREANFVADYLAGRGSAFLLHGTEAAAASQGITEHDIDPPYDLLLQHNASIFGKHAEGKTILVLREASACSAQALSQVVPQVDEQTQRLLCGLALATRGFSRRHVVGYVAAATDGQGRLYAKQPCAQYLPKPVRAFIYAQTHQEVDMAGAHYELIRRYVNSNSLPHIEVLRTALATIWGEDCCVGGENIIKMFPVRVINAGAPATLRFLQQHCLTVAGFVSTVAFDLDAAKVVCADAVLRHRADLLTTYTNRYFYACEYLEMQVMSKFVKAIQMRYRCASIIWLHDGVWLDVVVSSTDIAKAEQEAVEEVLPNSTHAERLFRTRSLATDYSQAVEQFSNIPTATYIFPAHPAPLPLRTSRKKPAAVFHDRRHHSEHDEVYHTRMRKRTRHF